MVGIADAGNPFGDYYGWDKQGKYKVLDSVASKVDELRRRRK